MSNKTGFRQGRLGIGKDPIFPLDISGSMRIEGDLVLGGTIADSQGNPIEFGASSATFNMDNTWPDPTITSTEFPDWSDDVVVEGAGKFEDGATAGEIYYNGGNVGIGTTNPDYKLEVNGTTYIDGTLQVTGTITGALSGSSTSCSGTAAIATNVTISTWNSDSTTHFVPFVQYQSGDRGLRTDQDFKYQSSTGTLTAPIFSGSGALLTGVNASTSIKAMQVYATYNSTTDTTCYPLFVTNAGTAYFPPQTKPNFLFNASTGRLDCTEFNGTHYGNGSNLTNLPWTTSGSNVYRSSGNVGIGTPTPTEKLEVNGWYGRSAHNNGGLCGSYNNIEGNSVKSNPIYVMGSNFKPQETTITSMYGVGYSHSNSSFIEGTGGWGFYITSNGTAHTFFGDVGSYIMNGNVGIGTTSPDVTLDVNGIIRASQFGQADGNYFGKLYNNKIYEWSDTSNWWNGGDTRYVLADFDPGPYFCIVYIEVDGKDTNQQYLGNRIMIFKGISDGSNRTKYNHYEAIAEKNNGISVSLSWVDGYPDGNSAGSRSCAGFSASGSSNQYWNFRFVFFRGGLRKRRSWGSWHDFSEYST